LAEDFAQSKTEPPTQRRREQARQQGKVAYSAELFYGLFLLASTSLVSYSGNRIADLFIEYWRRGLSLAKSATGMDSVHLVAAVNHLLTQALFDFSPFLLAFTVLIIVINLLQVGVLLSPEALGLKWERLSLSYGMQNLFSLGSAIRSAWMLAKVTMVVLLLLALLGNHYGELLGLFQVSLSEATAITWRFTMRLCYGFGSALVLLGLLDYGYQRFRFESSLWMTRQELKEELKREEGDPHMRARIRKLQREMARRQLFRDVPRATVVVTNPTHLAVALRYARREMDAPVVVAKGAGDLALRIADIARRHAVPVLCNPPLARALYQKVQVGQTIPYALYVAVAELLALVYRMRGSRIQ